MQCNTLGRFVTNDIDLARRLVRRDSVITQGLMDVTD